MPPEAMPAYILAGGRSRRFGSDKARACYQGEALILRQARQLQALGHRVTVVARCPDQYADLGLPTIADLEPDQGPTGGAITALHHCGQGWLILSSCDLVIFQPQWLQALLPIARGQDVDAVAYRTDRWQPFPGLYHTRLLQRPDVWQERSLQHLLNTARTCPLPVPPDWPPMIQVNTPDELLGLDRTDPPPCKARP